MALTVETGIGVAGADSYDSLAAVDAFHAARGNTAWAAADAAAREAALREATDYLDIWHINGGPRSSSLQGLNFPYEGTDDANMDLIRIRKALALLAPVALSSTVVGGAVETAQVLSATDKVGDISESRTYADNSNSVTVLGGVDVSFLSQLLNGLGSSGGMVIGHRHRG